MSLQLPDAFQFELKLFLLLILLLLFQAVITNRHIYNIIIYFRNVWKIKCNITTKVDKGFFRALTKNLRGGFKGSLCPFQDV